jgi:dolichyl-phosphate-mannose--protein O-mannosyl transferase
MTKKWFSIGMVSVFLLSLALRFWGLERFNTLVFDEVYYAKFGNNYLTRTAFFDGHPPLGKCIIAVGIWLSSHLPFWQEQVNGHTGSLLSPIHYRWVNALFGSFLPLIVGGVAFQLSKRRSFALLAAFFTACDGLFIVESRYALINIYIVIFGMLGQLLFLVALNNEKRRWLWLTLAGISFGGSISVKWNGLPFLIGTYLIWVIVWLWEFIIQRHQAANDKKILELEQQKIISPLPNLLKINIFQLLFFLGVIPVIVYCLAWVPHLLLDTKYGFIEVHKRIFSFHGQLGGNSPKVHPYCAAWYKWPLMTRPMAYFYQSTQTANDIEKLLPSVEPLRTIVRYILSLLPVSTANEPLPVIGPPLPSGAGNVSYDVHAMGNPFLWWSGLAAILFSLLLLASQLVKTLTKKRLPLQSLSVDTWICLYLVLNYAVNLLPWVMVTRCAFIYHYMTALPFVFLAIAWFVDQCIRSYYKELRIVGFTIIVVIVAAFIFWIPIYLGLPLYPEGYKLRMWFNSWV